MIAGMTAVRAHLRSMLIAIAMLSLMSITFAAPRQNLSFDFVKSDVTIALKAVADVSGANVVVGPEVKGEVTLKLTNVTAEEAVKYIANMAGCTYTVVNGIYMVNKPVAEKADTTKPKDFIIIKLQVAKAEDVIGALGIAYADVQAKAMPNNRLILSGDAKRLTAAKAFVGEIDTPTNDEPTTVDFGEATYQVKAVVPWQAKQYLEELYRAQGLTVSFAPVHRWLENGLGATETTDAGAAKLSTEKTPVESAPVANQNWVSDQLILRGPQMVVNQALVSLQKIDIVNPPMEKRCKVERIYPTQAIAYLLGQYESRGLIIITAPMTFTSSETKDKSTNAGPVGTRVLRDKDGKLNVSEPIGDFILVGRPDLVEEAMASLQKIDVGPKRVEQNRTLRFLQVGEAKEKLLELYGKNGLLVTIAPSKRGDTPAVVSETGDVGGSKIATGDAAQMKVFELVLSGPEDVVAQADQMLARWDVESPQIEISMEIVSFDVSEENNLGIDWDSAISTTLNELPSGDALKIGRILRDPATLDATINLMKTKNKARVISQPKTTVQNGREAVIHVGDTLLYETTGGITDGGGAVYQSTTVDTGVTLRVLPQMAEGGSITLDISAVVSDLIGFNKGISGAELPQLRTTSTSTNVSLLDGEPLIIGGLTQNGSSTSVKSVPILGDIPLIGSLFSSKSTKPNTKELVIIVKPKVVKSGTPQATTTPATPAESAK